MMDFSKVKDFSKLIGMGVAVLHPDGKARKHKIIGLKLMYDKDGFHVKGVELDLYLAYDVNEFLQRSMAVRESSHIYFLPVFLFRNKGDCIRAEVDERMETLLRMRSDELKAMEKLMEDYSHHNSRACRMTDEINELEKNCSKSKIFRKRKKHV